MANLYEGVRLVGDQFVFDFKNDESQDVVFLKYANTKSVGKKSGINVYFAWNFNANAVPEHISLFRKQLKNGEMISEQDKLAMINKGVIGFDSKFDINSFDIVVFPKSSSPLVSQIAKAIKARSANLLFADEVIVKNTVNNIKIDYAKYIQTAKTPEEKEERKKKLDSEFKRATKNGTFEIKKIHQFRKHVFHDYLIFKDDTSREIYNALAGGKVLIVDDYLTSGATLTEIIRLLVAYEPQSMTCFFLIK